MPDTHEEWKQKLKELFASKPKAPAPPKEVPQQPPTAPPGFGPAKSVGPVAPVLKQAADAVQGKKMWYARKDQ
jgi:hypothetical protein